MKELDYETERFFKDGEKICIEKSIYIENCLPVHGHKFMEIVYIDSGSGVHFLNGAEIPVEKGDLVFLAYKSMHTFRPASEDFSWINILFEPEYIDSMLINEVSGNDIIKLSIFRTICDRNCQTSEDIFLKGVEEEFGGVVELMYREYCRGAAKNFALKYYLLVVLSKIFMCYFEGNDHRYRNNAIINEALEEIRKNLPDNISLTGLAKKVHMNPAYFSRFFKQQIGVSFLEYVHNKRIEQACKLLDTTNMSINDVMNCVGFRDAKFFYKVFKEKIGVTPGDYRK